MNTIIHDAKFYAEEVEMLTRILKRTDMPLEERAQLEKRLESARQHLGDLKPRTKPIEWQPLVLKDDAAKRFEDSAAELANAAIQFFDTWGDELRRAHIASVRDKEGFIEGLHQIEALIGGRKRAQEAFLRAALTH